MEEASAPALLLRAAALALTSGLIAGRRKPPQQPAAHPVPSRPPPSPVIPRSAAVWEGPGGVNCLIQSLSDLIFTTNQSKPVSTELPFIIECGDPDKYQSAGDPALIMESPGTNTNLTVSVKQISGFFGFSTMAEQIQSIADRATFQAMKDKAQETLGAVGSVLFHKGVVGDWKNLFTESQNSEIFQGSSRGNPISRC